MQIDDQISKKRKVTHQIHFLYAWVGEMLEFNGKYMFNLKEMIKQSYKSQNVSKVSETDTGS